jgi:plastocyanin
MDKLWTDLLTFINQLVSPDWGALVALVPISILLLVVGYVAWLARRYFNAGPTRRGKRRLTPKPPPGVHAAETSWAPIIAAIGCFALLYGLVFKGWWYLIGVGILALALIYWLREGIRDYDHVEHPSTALVPVAVAAPPPGIHVPGPSFRPIVVSIALASLLYGFVFGGYLLVAGFLMLAIALLQWLIDARREYKGVVLADVTGHLPTDPRPGYPRGTLVTFAILFVGSIVLQAGILPPRSSSAAPGGSTAPSGAPPASGAPSGAPPASGEAGGPADVTIVAQNIAFEGGPTAAHDAPAGKPFTIKFTNDDAGIPHNVSIRQGGPTGTELFKGDIFPGVETRVYSVTQPLQAGTYTFICDVHPTMTGTLTVK